LWAERLSMITTCAVSKVGAKTCSLCKHRRLLSCLCRDCVEPVGARVRLFESNHTGVPGKCVHSHFIHEHHTLSKSTSAATITRQAALTNSSRSVALGPPFCASNLSELWHGTWWSGSQRESAYCLYVVTTLPEGDERALL
jgi:hypothetical protein